MTKDNYSSHIGGIEEKVLFYIRSVAFSLGSFIELWVTFLYLFLYVQY